MIRIRRIYTDALPLNREAIRQVQAIWQAQFPKVSAADVAALPEKLANPFKQQFRRTLFVAEEDQGVVRGFAIVLYAPQENFCLLEYVATAPGRTGGGLGAALYEQLREDARDAGVIGLFFECAPDDSDAVTDPRERRNNARRLKFYEEFGARPLVDNRYDLPLGPDSGPAPVLVFDDLGTGKPLARSDARRIVRAILERTYGDLCSPEYVTTVVESFKTDPVPVRPPRYSPQAPLAQVEPRTRRVDTSIALVINQAHQIHHVRERGYVEAPVRISSILSELRKTDLFAELEPKTYPQRHIRAVHAGPFVDYLKRVCEGLPEGRSVYPYVFPIRNQARAPKELPVRAGYYCIDTFTPLNRNAYIAARRAVDCALTAADALLVEGHRVAYALVRPPGHHAERDVFGGFCYFNSAAVAAHYLSTQGKVAVLDVDYHHGNGQQNIFYGRSDVLTVSIHGNPRFAYPYFTGFEDERGEGAGEGFNVNVPLPENIDGKRYRRELDRELKRIAEFAPTVLVVALGLDPAKGDPTGTWSLGAADFEENGRMIGRLKLPTLVVQEGGYRIRTLGVNARRFFTGLHDGMHRD